MLNLMFRVEGNIDTYPSFNFRFDFLGYNHSNFILLIGMPMFFLYINLFLIILYLLFSKLNILK